MSAKRNTMKPDKDAEAQVFHSRNLTGSDYPIKVDRVLEQLRQFGLASPGSKYWVHSDTLYYGAVKALNDAKKANPSLKIVIVNPGSTPSLLGELWTPENFYRVFGKVSSAFSNRCGVTIPVAGELSMRCLIGCYHTHDASSRRARTSRKLQQRSC